MNDAAPGTGTEGVGILALVGGGEWQPECEALDRALLAASGGDEVLVLPTAAAFEGPERVVARAESYFAALGATVRALPVLRHADADVDAHADAARAARCIYLADGSPMHLRSVLMESALFAAIHQAWKDGAVLAASGAGATLLCDPMVDPRGGAYTVGLGLVRDVAIFPYHGAAAPHLRERSVDLLPPSAVLAGVDEHTALVRDAPGEWRVAGPGTVTLYRRGEQPASYAEGPVSLSA